MLVKPVRIVPEDPAPQRTDPFPAELVGQLIAFLRSPNAPPLMMRLLLNRKDVARLLDLQPRTFDRLVAEGDFPPADVRRSGKFVKWTWRTVLAGVDQLSQKRSAHEDLR